MSLFTNASSLIFFKCEKYTQRAGHIFDVSSCPRPHYCIGFILSGEGSFIDADGGEAVRVCSGDIIFVPMGSRYTAHWTNACATHYISMHFVFDLSDAFPQKNRYRFRRIRVRDTKKTQDIFSEMLSFSDADDAKKLVLLGHFYSLLAEILPELAKKEALPTDPRLEKAVAFIEKSYAKKISVESLAEISRMSVPRFFPYFKQVLGVTPVDYINNYRIGRAIILLMNEEELSIEQISEMVGFESSAYFRRVFKKITGRSPREYKSTASEM